MSTFFTPMYPDGGFFSAGVPPIAMLAGHVGSQAAQQQFSTVTATPVPAGLPLGNPGIISTEIAHVTIAPSSPGTITFAHGLLHTPTMCWIIPELAEGTTPAVFYGVVVSDINATNIVINVSASGTYDVFYV